jgi:hypothetical protein
MMPLMQHAFANRSSVAPPDTRIAVPSQPVAAQNPAQAEQFPSYQESDFMGVGGNLLQTPTWLQSEGQVHYASMTQHLLQAKRNLQVSHAMTMFTMQLIYFTFCCWSRCAQNEHRAPQRGCI